MDTTLLNYQNSKVISRFKKEFPHAIMQPEEAFAELMKYIWLVHKHAQDKSHSPKNKKLDFQCVIHAEMKDIDNMWHTFILFTRDYLTFCNEFLGGNFFHHDPFDPETNSIPQRKYKAELRKYLSYIAEHLGEDTLKKWFDI